MTTKGDRYVLVQENGEIPEGLSYDIYNSIEEAKLAAKEDFDADAEYEILLVAKVVGKFVKVHSIIYEEEPTR